MIRPRHTSLLDVVQVWRCRKHVTVCVSIDTQQLLHHLEDAGQEQNDSGWHAAEPLGTPQDTGFET